jgi:mannosyltransferase OCH1-like enzyme
LEIVRHLQSWNVSELSEMLTKNIDKVDFSGALVFQFHGYADTPPSIVRRIDMWVVFKTKDSPDVRKENLGSNYYKLKEQFASVMADPNPYAKRIVKI